MCVPSFNFVTLTVLEKCDKIFSDEDGRNDRWKEGMMEGQGKSSIARLFHNTQHILLLKNKNVSQNSLEYFTLFASIELKD